MKVSREEQIRRGKQFSAVVLPVLISAILTVIISACVGF